MSNSLPIIYPKKLARGDHIRVIAPSRSGSILSEAIVQSATERLEREGFTLSFGKHWNETDGPYGNAGIQARIADLHEAFTDPTVDGIFTAIGGFNANQLLPFIDYDLIREHPKVFCGFSDITTLSNAFLAKSGLVSYLGPHFSSWAMEQGFEYTAKMFEQCVMGDEPFSIIASEQWSDDEWYVDQTQRTFHENNTGNVSIQRGAAEGKIIGGNINSFANLLGTEYAPDLTGSVLFLEQNESNTIEEFDGLLHAIIEQPHFDKVQAIVFGRFLGISTITPEAIMDMVKNNPQLSKLPIAANLSFGHTTPIATLAIGGDCVIYIDKSVRISVNSH